MNKKLSKYKYLGAKRLMLEAQELSENTEDYCARPMEDNLFEWHFTVRGPPDTAFDGGFYHGRLSFPTEYPMKPPSIILLTPNGRFKTDKKICLSISGYHPETWQPSWSVRTALLALIAFMPTKANGAIGSLDFSDPERRVLAAKSRSWRCETCGHIKDLLAKPTTGISTSSSSTSLSSLPSSSNISPRDSGASTSKCNSNSDHNSSSDRKVEQSNETGSETIKTCNVDPEVQNNVTNTESNSDLKVSDDPSGTSTMNTPVSLDVRQPQEQETNYPPIMLKSILILLFLLILRRIVMMVQS